MRPFSTATIKLSRPSPSRSN